MILERQDLSVNRIDLSALLSKREGEKELELIKSIVNEINEYINRVIPGLSGVATQLRENHVAQASQSFTEIIDGIDWIAQLIAIFKERYGANFMSLKATNISAEELERDLLDILTSIVASHIRNDWRKAADFIERELVINLDYWRRIFPQVINLEVNNTL